MYFDSIGAALTMNGHGAYVWSAYALSVLVLAYTLSVPRRRERRLLRELRGEVRRNAERQLRNEVELS